MKILLKMSREILNIVLFLQRNGTDVEETLILAVLKTISVCKCYNLLPPIYITQILIG
jgi:hypothetical protein